MNLNTTPDSLTFGLREHSIIYSYKVDVYITRK